jgi:hypothetical protein
VTLFKEIAMRVLLRPYNMRVSAARKLAHLLGGQRILPEGSRWRPRDDDFVINWGNSSTENIGAGTWAEVLNRPEYVATAIDKRSCLRALDEAGVPCVPFTTEQATAQGWSNAGRTVYARRRALSFGGKGIEVCPPRSTVPEAPLYTMKFGAVREYRVHVVLGRVIDSQQKRRRNGVDKSPVRSYANGYIYARKGVEVPENVLASAVNALSALNLDFGAVDVLVKESGEHAILEVNSAPGIEGTTLSRYAAAFQGLINDAQGIIDEALA